MFRFQYILFYLFLCVVTSCGQDNPKQSVMEKKYNQLTPEEEKVIIYKGTEVPFTGELLNNKATGTYICKRCNAPLYRSVDKFDSNCGWPSFDDEIPGAVTRKPDPDGRRIEIVCSNCGAHLGHVFRGEGFTPKNTRHCVNSISMKFIPQKTDTAYFASGCFWGTEYWMMKAPGVISTAVGFMGGHVDHPTYKQVCTGTTGHVETTEIIFDLNLTSYENLVKLFFETHDFTQTNGQGPDIGSQYLSVIFFKNNEQKEIVEKYIGMLTSKEYKVATNLKKSSTFWKAEDYHQQYYKHKGTSPYCHFYKKIF